MFSCSCHHINIHLLVYDAGQHNPPYISESVSQTLVYPEIRHSYAGSALMHIYSQQVGFVADCQGVQVAHLRCKGQQSLDDGVRANEGHKLGVHQLHLITVQTHKLTVQCISNGLSLLCGGCLSQLKPPCMRELLS